MLGLIKRTTIVEILCRKNASEACSVRQIFYLVNPFHTVANSNLSQANQIPSAPNCHWSTT